MRCFPGDSFWHNILHAWHNYNYYEPQNADKVMQECIWYNSSIRVRNRPLPKIPQCGIQKINDLRQGDRFVTYMELCNKVPGLQEKMSWLELHAIISAIPEYWKFLLKSPNLHDDHVLKIDQIANNKVS